MLLLVYINLDSILLISTLHFSRWTFLQSPSPIAYLHHTFTSAWICLSHRIFRFLDHALASNTLIHCALTGQILPDLIPVGCIEVIIPGLLLIVLDLIAVMTPLLHNSLPVTGAGRHASLLQSFHTVTGDTRIRLVIIASLIAKSLNHDSTLLGWTQTGCQRSLVTGHRRRWRLLQSFLSIRHLVLVVQERFEGFEAGGRLAVVQSSILTLRWTLLDSELNTQLSLLFLGWIIVHIWVEEMHVGYILTEGN